VTIARPDHLLISGTFNFRDVGGLRTDSGARIRRGVLLRSAHLVRVDTAGQASLRELGVTVVHDLRGPREIGHLGADILPGGVRLHATPFSSQIGDKPPHEVIHGTDGRQEMLQVYADFPATPQAGAAITAIAESIVRDEGAVLVHCAAGKDRTGWAVATLLRAVGVTEADLLEDYLFSNAAVESLNADIERNSGGQLTLSADLLGVDADYLAAATNSMHVRHGGLDEYLAAIGIGDTLRNRLRDRLLE
jgi:protein-tyrosine phosphatase